VTHLSDGAAHQDVAAPFRVEDAGDGRGPRRPAPIIARLPVGGTAITQSSLYGKWRAVPYLDDEAKPCGSAVAFKIGP
jgi:hypothetical protein